MNWKQIKNLDMLPSWYEAKVPELNWVYIVDHGVKDQTSYTCFLKVSVSPWQDEARITKKEFKTAKSAKLFCETHLQRVFSTLKKIF